MSPITASFYAGVWILLVGLVGVYFEVQSVHCGMRVRDLLSEEAVLLDTLRRRELEYNELISPDRLHEVLPEDFRHWRYPIPREGDGTAATGGTAGAAGRTPAAPRAP